MMQQHLGYTCALSKHCGGAKKLFSSFTYNKFLWWRWIKLCCTTRTLSPRVLKTKQVICKSKWKFVEKKKRSISAADKDLEWNQATQIVPPPSLSAPPGAPFTPRTTSHTLGWPCSPTSTGPTWCSTYTAFHKQRPGYQTRLLFKTPDAVLPVQVKLTVMNEPDLRRVEFYVNELVPE